MAAAQSSRSTTSVSCPDSNVSLANQRSKPNVSLSNFYRMLQVNFFIASHAAQYSAGSLVAIMFIIPT